MAKWLTICLIVFSTSPSFANETYSKELPCPTSRTTEFIKSYTISAEEVSFTPCNGEKIIAPKAEGQVSVSDLHLSKDKRWIGWAVNTGNCCTSYPVPTFLNIYNNGKFYTVNSGGQMIWNWYFSDENGKVLLEQGTVHGMSEPNIDEYDIKTGKKLRHIKDGY